MRSNSGGGKSSNNRGNRTLEEHERASAHNGAAITGDQKHPTTPDRTSERTRQSSKARLPARTRTRTPELQLRSG